MAGGTSTCDDQHREILQAFPFAPATPPWHWPGAVVSNPTPKNTTLPVRIRPCQLQRVHRRIHDAHVPAVGPDLEQVRLGARNAQHVSVGCENHSRQRCDADRAIHHLQRRDANRAAGPVNQFHLLRQAVRRFHSASACASGRHTPPSGPKAASPYARSARQWKARSSGRDTRRRTSRTLFLSDARGQTFFFQRSDFRQVSIGSRGFFLIHPGNRKAHVDQYIIADHHFRGECQVHALANTTEIHIAKAKSGISLLYA